MDNTNDEYLCLLINAILLLNLPSKNQLTEIPMVPMLINIFPVEIPNSKTARKKRYMYLCGIIFSNTKKLFI